MAAVMVILKEKEVYFKVILCLYDLFLFAHGYVDSARVIMDSLEEFKNASGLVPILPKSTTYFCNVHNYVKLGILSILPFEEGKLPVKYLGLPLVPSRLVHQDCDELMKKVKRRVNDWNNKSLSFAGRTQLIRFMLGSMHVYWGSVFILPSSLMLKLEQVMRGFLWSQGEMKKGKAKALIASHISNCDIYTSGFRLDSKVSDIIHHGAWAWPNDWLVKYPSLVNVVVPLLSEATDSLSLRHLSKDMGFSVTAIWECIRPKFNEIDWFHMVWFSHQIPRHAIHL
ncbi:hypothetical protein Tco_0036723, partial [Tanacetum coccineum]